MKKGTTVYEDQARKEAEYRKKHTVPCPKCGKDVLDHMTKCPACGAEIKPIRYQPLNKKTILKIKIATFIVGMAIAIVVLYFVFR